MDIVNRAAVTVRPKQPYLEWAKEDDAEGLADSVVDDLRREPAVYLVREWESPDEQREVLASCWPALFEAMLGAWSIDEADWPPQRSFEQFLDWFEIEAFEQVQDLEPNRALDYSI